MGAWTDVVGWDVVGINKRKKKKKIVQKGILFTNLKAGQTTKSQSSVPPPTHEISNWDNADEHGDADNAGCWANGDDDTGDVGAAAGAQSAQHSFVLASARDEALFDSFAVDAVGVGAGGSN